MLRVPGRDAEADRIRPTRGTVLSATRVDLGWGLGAALLTLLAGVGVVVSVDGVAALPAFMANTLDTARPGQFVFVAPKIDLVGLVWSAADSLR